MVWERLGNPENVIEPFFGSGAVLLARPHAPGIETVNDIDHMVANFWRATQKDPEAVASYADGPVNEVDLHSRHRWLVLSENAKLFRKRMRTDPDYFDPKIAGWWCWGMCCWIGSGWCSDSESDRLTQQIPRLSTDNGVCANPEKGLHQKLPRLSADNGVHGKADELIQTKGKPQLADAYSRGRGVHGNDQANTCAQRREWLVKWLNRLRDRLRTVRVCCGDWSRVCSSESTTTRLGTTGVFLDPPYSDKAERCDKVYAHDSLTVARDVRKWCKEYGAHPLMRIVLAGYVGEGHEELEKLGWSVVAWKTAGGYGNQAKEKENTNAGKERLWCSPHCKRKKTLFD